jgi:hypothetical protein
VKSFIEDAPGTDNLEYAVFRTDASRNSVYSDYKSKLKKQGYKEESKYSGVTNYKELRIHYYAFTKGLTGIVVGTFMDDNGNTNVIYTTGSVLNYLEIIRWLRSK